MHGLIASFSEQVMEAAAIGRTVKVPYKKKDIANIVVSGLGGSAIGGDVLRAYTSDQISVPVIVNRHYFLPAFVDSSTLLIISSYSGDTEETIAVHADAVKRGAKIVCISANGEIAKRARALKQPLITIPGGLPPRTALGYSFMPMLAVLEYMKFIPSQQRFIEETVAMLRLFAKLFGGDSVKNNPALMIAQRLHGKLPVVYSSADRFDVVNIRWRGQISENAKTLAYGHVVPEMNHNEFVGWSREFHKGNTPDKLGKSIGVVLLRDREDYARVQMRFEVMKRIIAPLAGDLIEVKSEGKSLLTRMFYLIHLGDWVSYHLAKLNNVDPTPVKVIDYLKDELGKK
jgi:glucose/mannose-6-phosphate isomerase